MPSQTSRELFGEAVMITLMVGRNPGRSTTKPGNLALRESARCTKSGFAAIFLVCAAAGPSGAVAQEQAADLSAYCVQRFGPGAEGTHDRRDNGAMCTVRTDGGLGMRHHKVDPAAVCRTLRQTSRFRMEGTRIICLSRAAPPAPDPDRKVNLADFCRDSYGRDAILSKRLSDNHPLCTLKGPRGLSQMHYMVDLAQLCGKSGPVPADAAAGDILDCSKIGPGPGSGAPATADSRRDGARHGPGGGEQRAGSRSARGSKEQPGPASPEVPETAVIPIAARPDLTGCGFARGIELRALTADIPDPPKRWEVGAAPLPCPALAGGFKPDLNAFCRDHNAGMTAGILADGRPICHQPEYFPGPQDAPGYWLLVSAVCYLMYPDRSAMRRGHSGPNAEVVAQGRLIPVVKYADGELECFYVDVESGQVIKDVTASMD